MKKLLIALTALVVAAPTAQAEVFVWKDAEYDIKVTYPDNWMRQAQLDDDLRLFVLGPQGADHAACRLYASHDARFMDAPAYAVGDVSSFVFTGDEIRREVFNRPDTDRVQLVGYSNTGSLGSGGGVTAQASFQKNWAGSAYPMRALIMATQYRGNRIFMSCETLANAWPRWESTMKAVFASVTFPAGYTIEPNGLYRRFQDDGGVILPLNRRKDGITIR